MQDVPEALVAVAQAQGSLEVVVDVLDGLAVHDGQVGQVAGHVLDRDLEVRLALPIGQSLMDLARLGIHEVGLQALPVPHQQRVGERAVTPEEAGSMELHEQAGHGIEQLVAVAPLALGQAHEEPAELERACQVVRGDDGRLVPAPGHQPARPDGRRTARLQLVHDVVLSLADLDGQLLEREDAVVDHEEANDVPAGAHGQVHELEVVPRPPLQRLVPGQLEAVPGCHRGSAS